VQLLVVLFLILVFPLWDRYEANRVRAAPTARGRLRSYTMTLTWSWIVTAILLSTIPRAQLFTPPMRWQLSREVLIGLGIGIAIAVIAPFFRRVRPELRAIEFLLPRTNAERILFAVVAVSAGITEEIIYRGFLIRYFEAWLGLIPAIVAATAVFALDHIYQGVRGVIETFAIGLLFTLLFVMAGGIWLPIVVHVCLDLRVMVMPHA
jgi:membrane protease YdiL (CAAX protease family)